MAVIDIIVIAVLVIFGVVGLVKGFLNTLLSLFGGLASLGVAILTAKPVAKFLDGIFHIVSSIGGSIAGSLSNTVTPFQSGQMATLTGTELKTYLGQDGLTFQERLMSLFIEDSKEFAVSGTDYIGADGQVVQYIGERLAGVISLVIAVVVMFVVIRLAVFLLSKLFDAITKNRAISGLDRTLGMVFGLLKASLLICFVLGIFYLVANTTIQGWIDNSVVTKWIYQYVTEFVEMIVTKFDLPSFITDLFPAIQTIT